MKKIIFSLGLILTSILSFGQYVPWGSYFSSSGPHGQNYLRSQFIDNVLFAAGSRFTVTGSGSFVGDPKMLFDGNYDKWAVVVNGGPATFTVDFASKGNGTITYADGYIYLHFYSVNTPDHVTGRVQLQNGTWVDITEWSNVASSPTVYQVLRARIPINNWMNKLEITIYPKTSPDPPTWFAQLEYVMNRVGQYENGIVTKFTDQTMYTTLAWHDDNNLPTASVDKNGDAQFTALKIPTGAGAGKVLTSDASGNATWQISTSSGALAWALGGNAITTGQAIGTTNQNDFVLMAGNTARMIIGGANGQVAIGVPNFQSTAFPGYKLFVEQGIRTRKVKVDANASWADYVFHKTYQLPTLEFVEDYIKKHQHLPDVPSAKQVAEDGIDLGDNQVLLLKKIEELTLYVINQNKKINEQSKRTEEMAKEIENLKQELAKQKNPR